MSSFGAGDLGSYMGGGGGNESPSQSSYSGNMQIIFLLLAGGLVLMCLVLNLAGGGPGGGPGGPGDKPPSTEETAGPSETTNPTENNIPGINFDESEEGIDFSKYDIDPDTYTAQADLDDASIFDSLAQMQAWKACGDNDLVLKLLERHSFSDAELYNEDDD